MGVTEVNSNDWLGFLEEYECLCRKYGMKASAYGSEVYAERIERVDGDEITEHIADLKDEGLKPNRGIGGKLSTYDQGGA